MNIWIQCQGIKHIRLIKGLAYRFIESQEKAATLALVDTLDEQQLLEELIESTKPINAHPKLHFLLSTPFRYPPLKNGSRFGNKNENGIFYAGLDIISTLAEVAYYRFILWYSMDAPKPKNEIRSEHSLFSFRYRSEKGIQLHKEPFDQYRPDITTTRDYGVTQQLGRSMRDDGIDAFEYPSARTKDGYCLGLFTPEPFISNSPDSVEPWFCQTNAQSISFKSQDTPPIYTFKLENFLIDGRLPPAA